nr:tetratricopeptide repeat-containing sulfotransferase family protein [Rhodoblastus acidophilus]
MEAEAICKQILATQPDLAAAHHLAGVIAHQAGRLADAIANVQRATALAPDVALFRANLGEMFRLSGRPKQAVEEGVSATRLDPTMPAAWSNLGAAHYDLKNFEAAARAQQKAIEANPQFAPAHCNLGNAFYGLKDYPNAIAAYRTAVALAPDYADAWANLGTALHHNGDYAEAFVCLRRAIALAPDHANARAGLGILLLMRGDFAEGLAEYEWRLRSSARKGLPQKPWRGDSFFEKHVHVQAEQGFGDTLQFARYVKLLAPRAKKVSFRVHPELAGLMRESLPEIDVYGDSGDPPPYHCDFALMSLPHLFNTRHETIPADLPYLRAPPAAVEKWRARLAGLPGLKVGINWGGNPEHANDHRRSLEVTHFAPLLDVPGVSLVSLQFGARAAELKKLAPKGKVLDLSRDLGDFASTAGAVAHLDLVISVDSSCCHLAGGLGKPVWILLSWIADWRWLLEREDSPWYPNARLFRQRNENWPAVMAQVCKSLRAAAAGDASALMPFKAAQETRAAHARAILALETRRANAASPAPEAGPSEPDQAEALHNLGVAAHQSGQLADAIAHLRRATAIAPDRALYHANLGEMLRLSGQPEEAASQARNTLDIDPNYPEALSNLAIALFDLARYEEALTALDKAVALSPNFARAHSNRGNALQRLKRFAEAEPAYRRALELDAHFAEGWNNLGTCLRELKRFVDAIAAYRKALALKPHDPDILDSLALALKDLEKFDEAEDMFRRALAIGDRVEKIHIHYGALLADCNRIGEAEREARAALALDPDNGDAINLLGRARFEQGDFESALACFHRALALNPKLAEAWNNMGNALKDIGKFKEAEAAYLKAIEINPDLAGAYFNLADSRTFTADDPRIAQMEALAARPDLSATDRLQLDFALGKAYADLKNFEKSFGFYLRGNAAKRAAIDYDETQILGLFDRIEAAFTQETLARHVGLGHPSDRPIFVLGMPRSGTTLVEQILASHPGVHGAGELMSFSEAVAEAGGAFPDFLAAAKPGDLRRIGEAFLQRLLKIAPESARVTDKMPSNFYFVGLIHLALPNAKIIHCRRDAIDTCLSCFTKLFSAEQNHTYDLAELGRYHRRYEKLMAHWRAALPPGAFLDLDYKDVVEDAEGATRKLLDFCGLPFDPACLDFHLTARPVRTASATQVRKPVYRSAVGRWRVYQNSLKPLLNALDLDPGS